MQMQLQGLGALPAHFHLAVEVVGSHALKSQRSSQTGSVKAVTQRPNVETVAAPCRGTQRQAHGVPHVHIHRAVEVAASHAPKDEPTMQNTCRNGFVNIAMQRNNVPTVPALCRATQRQAHGVPHVHIHRAVEVAASHAPKDEPTMQNTCRNGFVNIAMQRNNVPTVPALCRATQRQAHGVPHVHIHRAVEVAASHAPKDEPTMQNTCRNGFVNIAMQRNNVPTVPALCRATQRQAHGVPLVPIRHVRVVGRNGRAKVGTMSQPCRAGPAKPAR